VAGFLNNVPPYAVLSHRYGLTYNSPEGVEADATQTGPWLGTHVARRDDL